MAVGSLQLAVCSIRVYPNPATSEVIIEHAANCEVVFYDVVGRVVLSSAIASDKEVAYISKLAKGTYVLQVIDSITGEKVNKKVLKE